MPEANFNQSMRVSNNGKSPGLALLTIVAAILFALALIFFLNFFGLLPLSKQMPSVFGWMPSNTKVGVETTDTEAKPVSQEASPLFTSQTAAIEKAQITDVQGDRITVKDPSGKIATFKLSSSLQIRTYKEGEQDPEVSQGAAAIVKNKDAKLVLQTENLEYKVVNITYFAPAQQVAN